MGHTLIPGICNNHKNNSGLLNLYAQNLTLEFLLNEDNPGTGGEVSSSKGKE